MIKEITEQDFDECVRVIRESFGTVADEFGITVENAPRFTAFAVTTERLQWQRNSEHRAMYAYYEDNRIIGYYSLECGQDRVCELNNLCVLPAYRKQGIGALLLKHSFETAKRFGCVKMKLGIVEENKILRQWYEAFGFIHTGTQKFDFFPFTCGYMEKNMEKYLE